MHRRLIDRNQARYSNSTTHAAQGVSLSNSMRQADGTQEYDALPKLQLSPCSVPLISCTVTNLHRCKQPRRHTEEQKHPEGGEAGASRGQSTRCINKEEQESHQAGGVAGASRGRRTTGIKRPEKQEHQEAGEAGASRGRSSSGIKREEQQEHKKGRAPEAYNRRSTR